MIRSPWMLLLLALVPLLVYWRYARGRKPFAVFSDGDALSRLPVTWAVRASRSLPVLYAAGLSLLILALARPQTGLDESRVRAEAVDIVLLVDASGSMRAEDFSTPARTMNRLDAVKEVLERFVRQRPDDLLGMVVFSEMPYTMSPLTLDHAWLLQQMQRIEPGMVGERTAIGDAIAAAVNRLRDSPSKTKLIILLTDGAHNWGRLMPLDSAQAAKALGIKIYTVGAASDNMTVPGIFGPQTVATEVDEGTLKRIADITGAMYFRARDLKSLQTVYDQIDKMEKTEINVERFTRFEERFFPFAAAGLILLGLERLLSFSRLGRLP